MGQIGAYPRENIRGIVNGSRHYLAARIVDFAPPFKPPGVYKLSRLRTLTRVAGKMGAVGVFLTVLWRTWIAYPERLRDARFRQLQEGRTLRR